MTGMLDDNEVSLEELAKRSQDGDQSAFEFLVHRLQTRITLFLYRMVGSMDIAADLAQDSFIKAYKNIHRYDCRYAFSTWLFTIAKRTALNHFRSSRPTIEFEEYIEHEERHPRSQLESKDETHKLWNLAKRTLKPQQFEALWLRYGEDFTIEETAEIMKTNQIRVRVLVHRARNALMHQLEENKPRKKE